MGLLLDAAYAWNELCSITYSIELGHKRKQFTIDLAFEPGDLPHLAGMQYLKGVDFGLRRSEYYGAKLMGAVLSGKLDENRVYGAKSWARIEGRLKAIIRFQQTLSEDFSIAKYNPRKVSGFCNIDAEYVIKNKASGENFFIFLSPDGKRYFCKSAFQNSYIDYMQFQTQMTVLRVVKRSEGVTEVLHEHPRFIATALV